MSFQGPNLARRPFVNRRPVTRAAALLWATGGLLLLLNAALYGSYFAGSSERRQQLSELTQRIEAEGERVAAIEGELARFELAWQNRQVSFLNQKIAERTFPWSHLFDRLGQVLPPTVRLHRLSPRVEMAGRGLRGRQLEEDEVWLGLLGTAQSGEALLELVDALFAHPAFRQPNLSSEAVQGGELLSFSLSVRYLPGEGSGGEAIEVIEEGGADSAGPRGNDGTGGGGER